MVHDPALQGPIDLIFTTCDLDLRWKTERLLHIWDERLPENRFHILCIRHWTGTDVTLDNWQWIDRKAITFLTLGQHMMKIFQEHLALLPAAHPSWGVDVNTVATFAPVFIPSTLQEAQPETPGTSTKINVAALQGNMDEEYRAVNKTLTELFQYVDEDPEAWDYRLVDGAYAPLIPDSDRNEPFILRFVGGAVLPVDPKYEKLIERYTDPVYQDLFEAVHGSDVVIPAIPDDSEYFTSKTTSTIGVSMSARTVILLPAEGVAAYRYLCPAAVLLRPDEMSEMSYIRATRLRHIKFDRHLHSDKNLRQCQADILGANAQLFAQRLSMEMRDPKAMSD